MNRPTLSLRKDEPLRFAIAAAEEIMFGFWRQWKARRARVRADAADLIKQFGEGAYSEARARAIKELALTPANDERPSRHWDSVRNFLGKTTERRNRVDTATAYLERDRQKRR